MNVLEVVESSFAGVGRHVIGLCAGLASEGHRVTVAYAPARQDEAFRRFTVDYEREIRFIPLEVVRREISPATDLRGLIQLLRLIRNEGPFDVVHGHSSKAGGLARMAGRLSGIPTIYTPHSLIMSSPEVSKPKAAVHGVAERILGCLATSRMIAVSEEEQRFVLKLKLVPARRITVVENGVEAWDSGSVSEETVRAGLDQRPLTFGSTMRFSPQKAPGQLVEAFVRLADALPQVPTRLVIAGDGDLFGEVEQQVEESGWSERISLLGWRSEIDNVLRELDVFVLPSLYEGHSYAILEAMAAKLPIVSTNVFGIRGTLSGSPGNVVVPPGDPEALARGMRQMATLVEPGSLRAALKTIGRANHDYGRARFRQSECLRRTIEVYRTVLRRRENRSGAAKQRGGRKVSPR